ncbi:MAG: transketolase family protein [Coriobacteriales bacterium]|nr:transketolase family protein [Coriobacteriaceae bacterium]MDD6769048.1 transketolase family protein [Coriobacteriaceae bacterium]
MAAEATRAGYGETLVELVGEGLDIMAVEADLSGSTTTNKLGKAHPDRLVNVGIAEQNMIDVAAGLALAGKTVFTGSFAAFGTGRCYDQIRNTVCYGELDVKVAPTHAGVTVGPDGGSHQMLEDVSLMRGLPGMRVLVPADYTAAKQAIRIAAQTPGPFYVRLGRAKVPQVYEEGFELELGRAYVLREGDDVTLVANGVEVAEALQAAEQLASQGISAEVIDAFSVKPFDKETLLASVRKTGCVVSCEEHSTVGGLGSAVADIIGENCPVPLERVGVRDEFGTSGDPSELLAEYGLDAAGIVEKAKKVLARK